MRTKWRVPLDKQLLPVSGILSITVQKNTVLELHEPCNGKHLEVALRVQEGAQVVYITGSVQDLSLQVTLDARACFTQLFSSKQIEKRKQSFVLAGEKSKVEVVGSYLLIDGVSTFDVVQLHVAQNTLSNVNIKTVLDGTAQFEYRGTIRIEQSAQGSHAHQENKNLIVSNNAKALSIPSLEALNNDVKCGHGSAISYINEDHLFYLASRGIEHTVAKKMIIQGFIG